jgi:hypothetical protein
LRAASLPTTARRTGIGSSTAATTTCSASARGWRVIPNALGVGAAIALELRLDPVDRVPISLRTLAAVTELREFLDGRLVFLEVEAGHEVADGIC